MFPVPIPSYGSMYRNHTPRAWSVFYALFGLAPQPFGVERKYGTKMIPDMPIKIELRAFKKLIQSSKTLNPVQSTFGVRMTL